jgi:hypothetical protein
MVYTKNRNVNLQSGCAVERSKDVFHLQFENSYAKEYSTTVEANEEFFFNVVAILPDNSEIITY